MPSVSHNMIDLFRSWSVGGYQSGLENSKKLKLGTTYYHETRRAKSICLIALEIVIVEAKLSAVVRYNSSVNITAYILIPLMSSVLILYMSDETYSLKITLKYRYLRNFSWQFYLFSLFLPEICLIRFANFVFFLSSKC